MTVRHNSHRTHRWARVTGRRLVGVTIGAATIGLVAACGGSNGNTGSQSTNSAGPDTSTAAAAPCTTAPECELPQSVIDAAKREGTVTVYTGTPDMKKIVEAFTAKYGIKVDFTQLGGSDMTQRFQAEAASGNLPADIFQSTDLPVIKDLSDKFVDINESFMPNLKAIPDVWRMDKAFGWYAPLVGIDYNTEKVKEADVPKSFKDLLKPEYKGKLCLNDPRGSNGARQLWTSLDKANGIEYIKDFAKQNFRLIAGNTAPGAQAVASGDCLFSLPNYPSGTIVELQKKGAPIKWQQLSDPTLFGPGFTMVVKNSPHPNAARLLANFTASAAAAKVMCDGATLHVPADSDGKYGCVKVDPTKITLLDSTGTDAEFNNYLDILGIK